MTNETSSIPLPKSWLRLSAEGVQQQYNASTWPWTRARQDDFVNLMISYSYYLENVLENPSQIILWIVCALGLLGGCLIIATISNIPKSSRSNFYKITNIIAILDLVFLVDVSIREPLLNVVQPGFAIQLILFISSGTVYCLSLISDLLTLGLSIERFVALTFPIYYKKLNKTNERCFWNTFIILSTIISLCRARYAFGNGVFTIPSISNSEFFVFLTYLSDMILPVVAAAIMVPMVLGVLRVLIKRALTKAASNSQVHQNHITDSMKTMSLLAVLVVLFLLNQCCYIYYEIEYIRKQNGQLDFNSSLDEVSHFMQLDLNLALAGNVSAIAEVISKSFTFYNFVLFNATFRTFFFTTIKVRRDDSSSDAAEQNRDSGSRPRNNKIFTVNK